MKKYKLVLILLNLIVLLAFVNYSAVQKEALLKNGKQIYFELLVQNAKSPLIQGDMIQLKYKLARGIYFDTLNKRGFVLVKLDSNSIANSVRFLNKRTPVNANEYLVEYNKGYFSLNIGAENYFFQQGDAKKYTIAKYGAVKVDTLGNSILLGLYDEHLKKIE